MNVRRLSIAELAAHLASVADADPALLRALARDPRRGARHLAARWRAAQRRAQREADRLTALGAVEREQAAHGFAWIAGVDEAGVAPLAGPVVAAAVILRRDAALPHLDESKRLTPQQRETLYEQIMATATAAHVGVATVEEIDRLNVLQGTRLAHRRAILGLAVRPQLVLIDGRYPADVPVPQLVIVDGDATCASVAAASVLAKVTRDRLMAELDQRYPHYGFIRNKGYGTKVHLEAIRRYGITPVHRRSFFPVWAHQESLALSGSATG